MLRRTESRKDTLVQGRRITHDLPVTLNKNIGQLNRNLKLLITPPEHPHCEDIELVLRDEPLRRRSLQSSSMRRLPSRNKQNYNTSNHPAKEKKKSNSKPSSKSIKKNPMTDRSDAAGKATSRRHKKSRSPGESLQKKTKSLSKLDHKSKQSKSLKRKSFSPQHSHHSKKLERADNNVTKRSSKPVTAYTSRQTKSSCYTTRTKPVVHELERKSKKIEEDEQSPNSLLQFRTIKHRYSRKLVSDDRPLLKDSESISIAKELQGLLDRHTKSKSQVFKKPKTNKSNQTKRDKSKKVIVSQQTSKQRQIQSKDEVDLQSDRLEYRYRQNEGHQANKPLHKKSLKDKIPKEKRAQQLSIKTEYSMPSLNILETLAATKIQKCFRGYLARKQIYHYKRVITAAITIQRMWRGYVARKRYRKELFNSNMPKQLNESLYTVKDFNVESAHKADGISETSSVEPRERTPQSNSSRNRSEMSQSPSPSLMLEDRERQLMAMNGISKSLFPSPKPRQLDLPLRQRPNTVIESPTSILENLPNLQRIHRQKMLHHSRQQKDSLQRLVEQKMCSPRSFEVKSKEIDDRLQYEIERFQSGIKEVVRGWNITNEEGFLTPDSKKALEIKKDENKKLINAFRNSYDEEIREEEVRLDDLSVELSQYIEERPSLQQQDYSHLRFDSTIQYIQPYLSALFGFLLQQEQWKEEFLDVMKTPRNISITVLLKNLACVTEDSQDDQLFKLPLYKYLRCDNIQLINHRLIEQFHQLYPPMKRHENNDRAAELQQIYLSMLVEVLNYELNRQRPTKGLLEFEQLRFTAKVHPSLLRKQLSPASLLFHNYFAHALDELYRTANQLCGFIEQAKGIEQNYVTALNECRLNSMVNYDTVRFDSDFHKHEEELVELLVCTAQEVVMLLMEEAAEDIWQAYI